MTDEALADGFAAQARRWAQRVVGEDQELLDFVGRAAHAVSVATSAGHVCATLEEIATGAPAPVSPARLRDLLFASGVVAAPPVLGQALVAPLVLDRGDRLYLGRYYDYERRFAAAIAARVGPPPKPPVPVKAAATGQLALDFDALALIPADDQEAAVERARASGLTIVCGGPGTGKTATIVRLLGELLGDAAAPRIALAAPTGKAAARMLESIRTRAAALPEAVRARLPAESFTVHRLLGVDARGGFRHHAGNPLALDWLIVDEASMLDLALATRLIDAVPPTARIVLLGDPDQLAAVEAGAVFSELATDPALAGAVVRLRRNYRFGADSAIGQLAAAINAGDGAAVAERLRAGPAPALDWIDDAGAVLGAAAWERIVDGYADYLAAVRDHPADVAAAAAAFDRFRVLCTLRDGGRGVGALNDAISRRFRAALADAEAAAPWYPGRPVLVLRNDYALKLFNGDVGIVLPDPDAAGALAAFFPRPDGGFRAIAPPRLPRHDTAFAITVHQAQGSEFDRLLLVLPAQPARPATRELAYTAVTRGRHGVAIAGGAAVVGQAVASRTERRGGLPARFAEARGGRGE